VGNRWFTGFAGVCMVEATKQIYAGAARREARTARRPAVAAAEVARAAARDGEPPPRSR
jgi:hypothetical protein